jgi:hypothetical protein
MVSEIALSHKKSEDGVGEQEEKRFATPGTLLQPSFVECFWFVLLFVDSEFKPRERKNANTDP